jgi:hypothetical protein
VRVLGAHSIATMRTLEMKISDAGPYDQRINPHILTEARNQLLAEGLIQVHRAAAHRPPWYYLGNTLFADHAERYKELEAIQAAYSRNEFVMRLGQALEIAVYRALWTSGSIFFGSYPDLLTHDDSELYNKQEPPGRREVVPLENRRHQMAHRQCSQ